MNRRALIADELSALVPLAPNSERQLILDHACHSAGLRKAPPNKAAWLSLVAFVRHSYSDYDALLREGYDVESARHFCLAEINDLLRAWGCRRQVDGAEKD